MFDITDGLEKIPIYFENRESIGRNFKYIRSHVPGPGIDIELFEEQYSGCIGCDSIVCCSHQCTCLKYTGRNYKDRKLLPYIFNHVESKPILECNSHCPCSPSCSNRLVQNGIQIKLEVFKTGAKGLGLRVLEFLAQGTFVCEYAGEILSQTEAKERCRALTKSDMNYLIVLQEHCSSGLIQTFVDPKYRGNIGSFINHSCEPNLTMFPVRIDNSVPKLALFANQDINTLEELTFDYGISGNLENKGVFKDSSKRKPCFCGSKSCQALLPYDGSICI